MKRVSSITTLVAILTLSLVFATSELSAQSATRRNSSNTTSAQKSTGSATRGSGEANSNKKNEMSRPATGTNGRNYNDHITNISIGNNDRPNKGVHVGQPQRPQNNSNKPAPPKNVNYGNPNERYVGNRGAVNPPRYDRNNPNRYLGYNPFKDGRLIHRPAPYRPSLDFGVRFTTRPEQAIKIKVGPLSLYFSSGVWYNYSNGFYTIYRPPVGTMINYNAIANDLYFADFEVTMNYGTPYYVDSYANFYVPVRNYRTYGNVVTLKVVDAPIGAILYDLPSDYREISYNGRIYYMVGNSIFEYVYSAASSWYFRCIGQNRY